MKIQVISSDERSAGATFVTFRSSVGSAVGRWKGALPPASHAYDVEFHLEKLVVGVSAFAIDPRPASFASDGITNTLVAHVEQIDDDGVIALRVAPDCLSLLDLEGWQDLAVGQTLRLLISIDALTIWPTGY